jgi:hypothetical protein
MKHSLICQPDSFSNYLDMFALFDMHSYWTIPVSKTDTHLEHLFPSRKLNCCLFRAETSKNIVRIGLIFQCFIHIYIHSLSFVISCIEPTQNGKSTSVRVSVGRHNIRRVPTNLYNSFGRMFKLNHIRRLIFWPKIDPAWSFIYRGLNSNFITLLTTAMVYQN